MAKNQHQWGFMANTPKGDLAQCQVESCGKWRLGSSKKLFRLSHDEYVGMHNRGEIDASECLGEITNAFLVKPATHKGIEDLI
jgi:hypothetical protein